MKMIMIITMVMMIRVIIMGLITATAAFTQTCIQNIYRKRLFDNVSRLMAKKKMGIILEMVS